MIDYEKLKRAHKMLENVQGYRLLTQCQTIRSGHTYCYDLSDNYHYQVQTTNLDEILHALEELMKPEPKFKVDYEKLKRAHVLAEKIPYCIVTARYSKHDGANYYFECPSEREQIKYYSENINDLITKLAALTQPEPRYKVGDTVYRVNPEDEITECRVIDIDLCSREMYLCGDDDDYQYWWTEEQLYPTREALIQSQIDYWQNMLEPEEPEECEPVFGLIGEMADAFYTRGSLPYGFVHCDGSLLSKDDYPELYDYIKFEYGSDGERKKFALPDMKGFMIRAFASKPKECQHASDGERYLPEGMPVSYHCKKCGEFYR